VITIKPKNQRAMKQEQRYNIFKKTHKGLRGMLFDAGARIQQTDFTKTKQADAAIDIVKQTTRSFLYHLSKEDNILYLSVVLYAPYIVAMIEQTNAKDEKLAKSIDQIIDNYKNLDTKNEMISFGLQLQAAFFEFTAAVLQHMNKEETVINELLWSNYTDKQLVALEVEMLKQSTPEACTWYTGKILKELSNAEIIIWINGIAELASSNIIEKLINTTQRVLPIDRWQMIRGKFISQRDHTNKAAA
jgi:hemerythrin-like domain-containing protein